MKIKTPKPVEVVPGIFSISERGFFSMFRPPVNIYVITGPDGLVYDGGYGNFICQRQFRIQYREIEKICRERGVENNIRRVLLSHCHADHFSGLEKLRKKFGFRIILTTRMAGIIKGIREYRDSFAVEKERLLEGEMTIVSTIVKKGRDRFRYLIYSMYWGISFVDRPDEIIEDESTISINSEEWTIFHSPGHADDHITLYSEEKGILFSGDNVLRTVNTWLGPPRSDIDRYLASIRRMAELKKIDLILPAHGSPIDEPRVRLQQVIEWRWKRTDDIEAFLLSAGKKGLVIDDILVRLYGEKKSMKKNFARGWVILTLEKLVGEGIAVEGDNDRFFSAKV